MSNTFYSPDGNAEMWDKKPKGYFTPEEWAAAHPEPTPEPYVPTPEEKASTIRQQRNALLSATDYKMMPDYPMSELCRENLKLYRQLLRDIPEQPGFPNSVVWPIKGE